MKKKVLLIPKNVSSIAVVEISTKNTAFSILKYNHSALKGNLEEKRNILNNIYLEYKPLLKTPIEGYVGFFNKTNAFLNTLHTRHNNKIKGNNKNRIVNLNENEMEKWYDELYQLLLFCVLIKENLNRKNDVEKFLKKTKE